MFSCPDCRAGLAPLPPPLGVAWECASCAGRAADLCTLRRTPAGAFVRRLWMLALRTTPQSRRGCPGCGKPMVEIPTIAAPGAPSPLRLDVCPRCELVWFDAREHQAWLCAPSSAAASANLPPETQQALEAKGVRPPPPAEDEDPDESPQRVGLFSVPNDDVGWKHLLCVLGLPVEVDAPELERLPLATWILAAVIVVVSVFGFARVDVTVRELGLVPADLWRHGGLTFLTSFFLHGDLWHLLGNLYFLLVFGDDVEDRLGAAGYLLLITLSAITGDLLHALINLGSTIPTIGASGGISGIIAFYALRFPRRRLRRWAYGVWYDLRVSTAIGIWVAFQVIGAVVQMGHGGGGIAYLAHLGGAVIGLLFWALDR